MSLIDTMLRFSRIDELLTECIESSDRDRLVDSLKLLAIELAEYRHRYGRLSGNPVVDLFVSDERSAQRLTQGLLECTVALAQANGRIDILRRLREDIALDGRGEAPDPADALAEPPPRQTRSPSERIFFHETAHAHRRGWYFTVRGGHVYGPFPSEAAARQVLEGLLSGYRQADRRHH